MGHWAVEGSAILAADARRGRPSAWMMTGIYHPQLGRFVSRDPLAYEPNSWLQKDG